jgi:hypothetical protein
MRIINNFQQHLQKYNQFNEAQKMTSLHQPTDAEIQEAEEYLTKGIDSDWDYKNGNFVIDITGKYSVYYTLWRFKPKTVNAYNFITNLSTDFKTAVEKAKKAAGRIPVIIDKYGTKAGLFKATKAEILTFGKYRGKTLGDVFVEDPQYIIWLYKNYDGKSEERKERLKYYNDLYWETITKKNIEESKSEFQGKVGDKVVLDLKVYKIDRGKAIVYNPKDFGETYSCKMIDKNGNRYMTYNIDKKYEPKVDDEIKLQARIASHKEKLGIKFTVLNYCKVLSSMFQDIKKYNL